MVYIIPLLTILLSAVFLTAALAKAIDLDGAKKAAAEFGMPSAIAGVGMALLVIAEIAVALLLLFSRTHFSAAIAAAVLLFVFLIATARLVIQGKSAACHCFGQLSSEPVGKSSLVRNALLLVAAIVVAVFGRSVNAGASGEMYLLVVIAFVLSGLLITSVLIALELRERFETIDKRLRGVEKYSSLWEMQKSGDEPSQGLPVGTLIPDLEVNSLAGESHRLRGFGEGGLPSLFVFVGPESLPCLGLAELFPVWADALNTKVRLIVISIGDGDENLEKFGAENSERLFLQEGNKVSDALRAKWTPTALLAGVDGRIASVPAAGDNAIKDLVEKIGQMEDFESPLYVGDERDTVSDEFGTTIPSFELERIDGSTFTEKDLLGKPTLVVFWSLTCQYCTEMLEEMLTWNESSDALNLEIVADGERAKLEATGLGSRLVIDRNYKVSASFGMFGTPSAVIVDESGRVVSETAQGAQQINLLAGGVFGGGASHTH